MNIHIQIPFKLNDDVPAAFPTHLKFNEEDPISHVSYTDAFIEAQEAYIPYYSIAVLELGDNRVQEADALAGEERIYKVYDTVFISRYFSQQGESSIPSGKVIADPLTRRPIRKVHYFVLKCFAFDQDQICKKINLSMESCCLIPLQLETHNNLIQTLFLYSVDAELLGDKKITKEQVTARTAQSVIAEKIKEGEIFPELEDAERAKETLQWYYCSAQGSYRGLVDFADECLQSSKFIPITEQTVYSILVNRMDPPPEKFFHQTEKKAYRDAISCLKELGLALAEISEEAGAEEIEETGYKKDKCADIAGPPRPPSPLFDGC